MGRSKRMKIELPKCHFFNFRKVAKDRSRLTDGLPQRLESDLRSNVKSGFGLFSTSTLTCKKQVHAHVKRLWPRRNINQGRKTLYFTRQAWPGEETEIFKNDWCFEPFSELIATLGWAHGKIDVTFFGGVKLCQWHPRVSCNRLDVT